MLKDYYDSYWKKRTKEKILPPIRNFIPGFLRKYTSYGAILNCIPEGSKILDVGCGDGNVAQLYLKKGEVYGVDISAAVLKLAQKKGIKTKLCDLNKEKLPFADDFFDVVIFTDVVEHLISPLVVLKEAKRVLKKDGRLIITVPNFARLANRIRMLSGDPLDILHWAKYGDETEHLHWFTKPKLVYLLRENGFKNIRFIPTGLPYGFIFGLLLLPGLGNFLTVVVEK